MNVAKKSRKKKKAAKAKKPACFVYLLRTCDAGRPMTYVGWTTDIAARLDQRFQLLTGGRRSAAERHQTLRAAIDWSHDLLSEPERVLFRRLAVFMGGWTLETATADCRDQGSTLVVDGVCEYAETIGQCVLGSEPRYTWITMPGNNPEWCGSSKTG